MISISRAAAVTARLPSPVGGTPASNWAAWSAALAHPLGGLGGGGGHFGPVDEAVAVGVGGGDQLLAAVVHVGDFGWRELAVFVGVVFLEGAGDHAGGGNAPLGFRFALGAFGG